MDSVLDNAMELSGAVVFAKPSIPSLRPRHIRGCSDLPKKGKLDTADAFSDLQAVRYDPAWSSLRTRRDTRSADSRGVESASSNLRRSSYLSHCSSGSSGGSSNHYPTHSGSSYTSSSSLKIPNNIRESHSKSSVSSTCSRTSRMGVLCIEKHDVGERCECEGMSANSPRPATLHSYPPSPCESSAGNSQDSVKRVVSRKRSLDASIHDTDDTGSPVIRRRPQRSPSVGSMNGVVVHTSDKDKLSSDIVAVLGQNGFKREAVLNGVKVCHGYQNGTRSLCCLGLETVEACSKCVAHHHPAVTIASISSPPSPLTSSSQPATSPVSFSCHSGRGITISHSAVGTSALSHSNSTSVLSVGSISHPVTEDLNNMKRPQPPSLLLALSTSLLSSPAAPSSQQQQLHQPTQGSASSNIGSSNNNSNGSSDDKDGFSVSSAVALPSRCASASPNPTVLSLRQRPLSSNTVHKSLSQPASPQSVTSFSSKPKSLLSSTSLPSLSTLVTEPSPPVTPSAVLCRWRGCSCGLDASDLLEHIRKHVETQIEKKTYSCLWTDCKVFNKPSWSDSWLERHIVSHSGHRPFKCILDNCGQRFHSQAALERHVNGHFTATSQNGTKSGRTREEISHRMLQKRKRQFKRKFVQTVKRNDFFDEQTMAAIKRELTSLSDKTQLDVTGSALHTTFHGLVVGRRCSKSGSRQSLVEFTPSHVLEDMWSPEEEAQQMCKLSVPISGLPMDTVSNLHGSCYRQHRFRKHRRK